MMLQHLSSCCTTGTVGLLLLLSALYEVLVSSMELFHWPAELPCDLSGLNLTLPETTALGTTIKISFGWGIGYTVSILVVTLLYLGHICFKCCLQYDEWSSEKTAIKQFLEVSTIAAFPAPLFNIKLFLKQCSTAYAAIGGGLVVYCVGSVLIIVVEHVRCRWKCRCKSIVKAVATVLHAFELAASLACLAAYFTLNDAIVGRLKYAYVSIASYLALSTWLKHVVSNIQLYRYIVNRGQEGNSRKCLEIIDMLLCLLNLIAGVILTVILSYDVLKYTVDETKFIALVLLVISVAINTVVHVLMCYNNYRKCGHCEQYTVEYIAIVN